MAKEGDWLHEPCGEELMEDILMMIELLQRDRLYDSEGNEMLSLNDWAAKAARKIHEEVSEIVASAQPHRQYKLPSEQRMAAIIAVHAKPILALLNECGRGGHSRGYNDEACDYPPCATSYDENAKCTCGADKWNARVDAALNGESSK